MSKRVKIGLIVGLTLVVLVSAIAVWLVHDYHFVYLSDKKAKTWVEIDPRQCGDHRVPIKRDVDNVEFPLETMIPKLTGIVESQKPNPPRYNVAIYDAKSYGIYGAVCESCACPRGDRLYLWVADADLETFLAFDYKESKTGLFLLRKQQGL